MFNEEEMIKLCQELGIDLVESETKKPQLNGKDLEIEDIVSIFKGKEGKIIMKYLMITLHDKDFYEELIYLGRYIADRVENCLFDADKIDYDFRKSVISYIISVYMLQTGNWDKDHLYDFPNDKELSDIREYIDEHLQIEIVDSDEVHSDNDDTLYVLLGYNYNLIEQWFIV